MEFKKQLQRDIKLLMTFNFFSDFRVYSAFAIIYFVSITKSITLGITISSIITLTSALAEIPTGIISDMAGRKKTIIIGSIFSILSIFLYAISTSFWSLAIGSVLGGISLAFFSGNNEAYLYDILAAKKFEKDFDSFMGKYSAMSEIGMVVSALLGALVSVWGIQYTFYISIIPQIICIVISFIIKDTKMYDKTSNNPLIHFKESFKSIIKNKKLTAIITTNAVDFAMTGSVYEMAFLYVNTIWPIWAIAIYKSITSFIGAFGYWISGKVIKKFKYKKTLIYSNLYTIGAGLAGFLTKTVLSPLFISTRAFSFGIGSTASSNLKQKNYDSRYRSTLGSLDSLLRRILLSVVSIIIGIIADMTSVAIAFVISQIVVLISTVLYSYIFNSNFENNN